MPIVTPLVVRCRRFVPAIVSASNHKVSSLLVVRADAWGPRVGGGPLACSPRNGLRGGGLCELAEIGLAAICQNGCANLIAQFHDRRKIGSRRLYRRANVHVDANSPGEPLIAAQHRSGTPDGSRNDRQFGLHRDLEGSEIEGRKAR